MSRSRIDPPTSAPRPSAPRSRIITGWFAAMALGGFGFGLMAERPPFGDDFFAHPFVAFFVAAGAGLLILRFAAGRPVPELIAERALALGCAVGVAAFLAGNWVGVHVLMVR
jgi:hypothetical protein